MKVSSSIGAVKCLFLNEREPYWPNKRQQHTATSVEIPLQDFRWEKRNFPPKIVYIETVTGLLQLYHNLPSVKQRMRTINKKNIKHG